MKKAIIIGATSGIGRKLAEKLISKNWIVGITGRRKELLEELRKEYPSQVFTKQHNICDLNISDSILESLFNDLGKVDVVIVSSGIAEINKELDWEIENQIIQTNVNGIAKVYQYVFTKFRKQSFGHLVGVSSIAAIRGNRHCPSYNAAKAFQANYLEGLRCISKKKKLNITVTDIQPGFVDTPMAKGDGLFWVSSVEKAANQIYSAIKKRKRKAYVSKRWIIIAYVLKLLPNWLLEKI